MHSERLETLIKAAAEDAADIAADDLLFFDSDHIEPPSTLLRGRLAKTADWLDVVRYVRANCIYGRDPISRVSEADISFFTHYDVRDSI